MSRRNDRSRRQRRRQRRDRRQRMQPVHVRGKETVCVRGGDTEESVRRRWEFCCRGLAISFEFADREEFDPELAIPFRPALAVEICSQH